MSSDAALEIDGLSVAYGGVHALRDISLTVPQGAVVALLGPNGAGKSTTLRTVSGIVRAERGTITAFGRRIERAPAYRIARMAVVHVPEGRGIFPSLTVRENLEMASTMAATTMATAPGSQAGDPIQEATELFPVLGTRQRQTAGSLSGGEQQMLALARAIMSKPRLLMVDEISMGLAPDRGGPALRCPAQDRGGGGEPPPGRAVRGDRARAGRLRLRDGQGLHRRRRRAERPACWKLGGGLPGRCGMRRRMAAALLTPVVVGVFALGPWGAGAGADTSLVGYNGSALAIGSQFAFNVPGVVPLPNENLIEEDVPFARMSVGSGPVVDSLSAPYYPGDIAADLGSLLQTFGAPALPLNDPFLAESKYPTSPGYPAKAAFNQDPNAAPGSPTVFSSSADSSSTGGDATGTVTDIALDNVAGVPSLPGIPATAGSSLVDVGNISSTNKVTLGATNLTSTATAQVSAIQIAGLVDIAGLTSTASAVSDGTTGTPTATLHLGAVTVDGQGAYIDGTGVHITSGAVPPLAGITPAQLQQTVDSTLSQDGISIRTLDPKLTNTGASATADAGGLVIAISHQFDVPFIPGEPTIPIPVLGNVGLPAGVYTATTSITFGLAQAKATASGVTSNSGTGPTPPATTGNSGTAPSTLGSAGTLGSVGNTGAGTGGSFQSLAPSGPGTTTAPPSSPPPNFSAATSFPIHGIPPPIGWTITLLLACLLVAYPLLLLAKWQFTPGRSR